MSDGRAERGVLYDSVRRHFALPADLDLCAVIYGESRIQRSRLAALSTLVVQAAIAGDVQATAIFSRAADELAQMVHAVHDQLQVPEGATVMVSYSGGMFQQQELLLRPLQARLARAPGRYRVVAPRLSPVAGAALYAAKLSGNPLGYGAVDELERSITFSR